jgi:uncharacterized protein YndB with AHSA1/START domain
MSDRREPRGELRFERVLHAPRTLVFRCMIEPEHLAHFWGPQGMSTPLDTIVVNPRPGGAFDTVMINDSTGERYATSAVFDIVDEPNTLAWTETASGMHVTITLVAVNDQTTRVEIHQARVPEAAMTPLAQAGFLTSLDRFDRHLTHLQHHGGQPS